MSLFLCFLLRDAEPEAFTEKPTPGFVPMTPCNVSVSTTRPPLAPTPALPVVGFAPFDPARLKEVDPQKPSPASENLGEMLLCVIKRIACLPV